ncbi:MAG: TetR family transcriptional regulator, partial [candidate division Zixibacteria bacterium]|nr:TetR family transcriptional regulator [candidate division Zixibacteria bacterium]
MTTTAAPSPNRKPTSVRKTEIVAAAMRILATEGARHFTTERVAAAVGITGGTIFRHFSSMDAILDAMVDHIDEILFADFPPDNSDPLEA